MAFGPQLYTMSSLAEGNSKFAGITAILREIKEHDLLDVFLKHKITVRVSNQLSNQFDS